MARRYFFIRPVTAGEDASAPALHLNPGAASRALNVDVRAGAVVNRFGYAAADRSLGEKVYGCELFALSNGTQYTLYLTAANLAARETGAGNTFSYKTQNYATGDVSNITGAVVTGHETAWDTSGLAAGDKFILTDDLDSDSEPDANWATIQSVDNATQITLTGNYTGTTGAFGAHKNYRGRLVYSVPANERWAWASFNDVFYFTNGNTALQRWTGTGFATAADATNATNARYCIDYADRIVLADVYVSGNRCAYTVQWCKNGDPTDWTDATAGAADMTNTSDIIMGLGRVGGNLIVYKADSFIVAHQSGISTEPIYFSTHRKGVGCAAPYSIVDAAGTNFWMGRDDFYYMDGDTARACGSGAESKIKHRFFDICTGSDIKTVTGGTCHLRDQVLWFADTEEGRLVFAFNHKTGEWSEYELANACGFVGRGA